MITQKQNNIILGFIVGLVFISLFGLGVIAVSHYREKDNKPNAINNQTKKTTTEEAKIDFITSENDYVRGNNDAKLIIVNFSDIECSYCKKLHENMEKIIEDYPNDVLWVFKHFPLSSIHADAQKAAEATECADDQGRFWDYLDNLFANQSKINYDYFSLLADELGLDKNKFDECLSSSKFSKKVADDYAQGKNIGVQVTPTVIIDGILIKGAVSYESIKASIK
jgi:protein-disulfide isomerase